MRGGILDGRASLRPAIWMRQRESPPGLFPFIPFRAPRSRDVTQAMETGDGPRWAHTLEFTDRLSDPATRSGMWPLHQLQTQPKSDLHAPQ
jgi:hypothetical protein